MPVTSTEMTKTFHKLRGWTGGYLSVSLGNFQRSEMAGPVWAGLRPVCAGLARGTTEGQRGGAPFPWRFGASLSWRPRVSLTSPSGFADPFLVTLLSCGKSTFSSRFCVLRRLARGPWGAVETVWVSSFSLTRPNSTASGHTLCFWVCACSLHISEMGKRCIHTREFKE